MFKQCSITRTTRCERLHCSCGIGGSRQCLGANCPGRELGCDLDCQFRRHWGRRPTPSQPDPAGNRAHQPWRNGDADPHCQHLRPRTFAGRSGSCRPSRPWVIDPAVDRPPCYFQRQPIHNRTSRSAGAERSRSAGDTRTGRRGGQHFCGRRLHEKNAPPNRTTGFLRLWSRQSKRGGGAAECSDYKVLGISGWIGCCGSIGSVRDRGDWRFHHGRHSVDAECQPSLARCLSPKIGRSAPG